MSLMPYSIFKRLDIGYSRPTPISLQLVNHFVKYLLGILEEVHIKEVDFYVPVVIPDIVKDAHT